MSLSQLWPPVEPRTLTRQVWDSTTARGLPGVGRALGLYSMIGSCPLELVKGSEVRSAGAGPGTGPRLLDRPDPDQARPTFVNLHVEDYLLHGNACHLVTARDAAGRPAAVRWYPAHRWGIQEKRGQPVYTLDGLEVPRAEVVHAQRGADPVMPWRGVGVVEQHLRSLNRIGLQEAAEASALTDRGMPSVAIISPNTELDPVDADKVADKWVERFRGSEPKPGIFPAGTQVVPLSWKPTDSQMVEARSLSAKDLANLFNLDGYWLGAEGSSHTYRTPGPMFLVLTKTALGPVMDVLEDVWSAAWFPHGSRVRFNRTELLRDDLPAMVQAFTTGGALFPDPNEPREYMGFPALPASAWPTTPAPAPEPAGSVDPPTDNPDDDDQEDNA